MNRIEECGMDEGGMPPMAPPASLPAPEVDKGNPVTVNVSMNASGKEHVEDLLAMMKNAGLGGAKEVVPDMMPMRQDMERLNAIVGEPKDMDDLKPGMQDEPCPKCGKMHMGMSSCNDSIENDDEAVEEGQFDGQSREDLLKLKARAEADLKKLAGADNFHDETQMMMAQQYVDDINDALAKMGEGYDNEPDEQYGALDDVIDSGDDLHKSKKAYKATQDGDNPMALEDEEETLEQQILRALQDDYEGFKEGDAEDEHDHEDGADMEACPECGDKKQKLMACSSCGCK